MTTDPWVLPEQVRTERLLLRVHRPDDVDDLLAFHSDAELVRYLPWPVRTRDEVIEFIAKRMTLVTAAADGDWVSYAIELAAGADADTSADADADSTAPAAGPVIGEVLLKRVDAARGIAEVGYAVAAPWQGRGLASEAVAAMLELGGAAFGVREVRAVVDERNAASIALLERFGFVLRGPQPDEVEQHLMLYVRPLAA